MKKILLFFLFCLLGVVQSFAYDAKIDDIYYDFKGSEATVTYMYFTGGSNSNAYSGDLVIPGTVEHGGRIYSVTSIGSYAFSQCLGLASVTIPNSVTTIGNGAFSCSGLVSVTIPNSITTIGEEAFYDCRNLTSITIPNSVTTIRGDTFYKCSGLTSVTIPNSVTRIGYRAFYGCSNLTSITIPRSVTTIGESAFSRSGLSFISIPNSVTTIERDAFDYCSSLTSVTISRSVSSIESGAFNNCSNLTFINIEDIEAWCKIEFFDGNSNPLCYAHHLYLNGEEITDLVIPNSVTMIGSYAFYGWSGLTSATIPESVSSIGVSAFLGCTGLTSVTIPKSVTSIERYAFQGCSGLTSVTIPNSVTMIGSRVFTGCSSLSSVTIPNSVTSLENGIFSGCFSLTSVTIPNSVISIGEEAFLGCKKLTFLTIPESVTTIAPDAFEGCSGLKSFIVESNNKYFCSDDNVLFDKTKTSLLFCVITKKGAFTIPETVTTIGSCAFADCSTLTSITIPESVTTIGSYAFYNCYGLCDIYSLSTTPPTCDSYVFYNVNTTSCRLHVPIGTREDYASDNRWRVFSNILEDANDPAEVSSPVTENCVSEYYDLSGRKTNSSYSGLRILSGKNGGRKQFVR